MRGKREGGGSEGGGDQCSMPPSIFSFDHTMTNTERERKWGWGEGGGRKDSQWIYTSCEPHSVTSGLSNSVNTHFISSRK